MTDSAFKRRYPYRGEQRCEHFSPPQSVAPLGLRCSLWDSGRPRRVLPPW